MPKPQREKAEYRSRLAALQSSLEGVQQRNEETPQPSSCYRPVNAGSSRACLFSDPVPNNENNPTMHVIAQNAPHQGLSRPSNETGSINLSLEVEADSESIPLALCYKAHSFLGQM
ncbi:hypothetical protein PoB_001765600 [Plakobranchus ocellatus]|uniref:Uncharacterized protein n=1 Tax=Plakobranchus ocellatus TaxID=259542 RepID=A0AAV3Z945_9GAST|nr:hypothetical protein PoB_001765600 [Plakobranchus ocellatus]